MPLISRALKAVLVLRERISSCDSVLLAIRARQVPHHVNHDAEECHAGHGPRNFSIAPVCLSPGFRIVIQPVFPVGAAAVSRIRTGVSTALGQAEPRQR